VVCDNILDHGIVPDEYEVRRIAQYLTDYRNRWLNQSFQDAMAHFDPYDIDGGANAGFYLKRPDGRWAYRKRTWTMGSRWWSYGDESLDLCIAHNEGRAELVHGEWLIKASSGPVIGSTEYVDPVIHALYVPLLPPPQAPQPPPSPQRP